MKLLTKWGSFPLLLAFLFCITQGCGGSKADENQTLSERIVGLWAVEKMLINTNDITNDRNWFDFHADGTVDTRAGEADDKYQSGNWTISEQDSTLKLESEQHGTMTYDLNFDNNRLTMKAPTSGKTLTIISFRTDKKPVERK